MIDFDRFLRPIQSRLDEVLDFSKVTPNTPHEHEEYPYLENIAQISGEIIKKKLFLKQQFIVELEKLAKQAQTETGDDRVESIKDYNRMMTKMEDLVSSLNRDLDTLNAPYFGKIIFEPIASRLKNPVTAYIGKFGIFDKDTNRTLVADWRSPIASLYYTNAGPTKGVTFSAPAGEQSGDLSQKRQFEITEARFNSIYDAKSGNTAADEFLLKQLNNRLGKKLSDIVATIQSQQNEIIREGVDKPMIIQGVAGSGKTTIILHRISYILYHHSQRIKSENSLVIAPNRMFLDYISDVLPSLGVEKILQNTYLNWAKEILQWQDRFVVSNAAENFGVKRLKGGAKFMKFIDKAFGRYLDEFFDSMPDLRREIIRDRYYELENKSSVIQSLERINLAIEFAFAQRQFDRGTVGASMGELDRDREKVRSLKDHTKTMVGAYAIYKEILNYTDLLLESGFSEDEIAELQTHSGETLVSKGKVSYYKPEDLAALVYIEFKLSGKSTYERDYIVVDEAQDLSVFQLVTLYMTAKNRNITIAGDVAQAIIPPFYIRDWDDLISALGEIDPSEDGVNYHQLFRCYRTTAEVIEYANRIFIKHFPNSYKLPEAVLRHGDPVREAETGSGKAKAAELIKLINESFERNSATTAIVCRDEEHADEIYALLKTHENELPKQLSSYQGDDYRDGVLVLPVRNAKGLEFDSVIIADVDQQHYNDGDLDVRLLYVAVTRALHRLYLTFESKDKRSELLG